MPIHHLAGLIAVRRSPNEASRPASSGAVTVMIKEMLARQVESWFSSIGLLSDAVVVEALGDLFNYPASDAEPTMFMTMQHSARRRRLRPMRRVLARRRAGDGAQAVAVVTRVGVRTAGGAELRRGNPLSCRRCVCGIGVERRPAALRASRAICAQSPIGGTARGRAEESLPLHRVEPRWREHGYARVRQDA